jgi:hypothetical protein
MCIHNLCHSMAYLYINVLSLLFAILNIAHCYSTCQVVSAPALRFRGYGVMHPAQRLNYERTVEQARSGLEEQIFTLAWSEGRMITLEEALAIVD